MPDGKTIVGIVMIVLTAYALQDIAVRVYKGMQADAYMPSTVVLECVRQ